MAILIILNITIIIINRIVSTFNFLYNIYQHSSVALSKTGECWVFLFHFLTLTVQTRKKNDQKWQVRSGSSPTRRWNAKKYILMLSCFHQSLRNSWGDNRPWISAFILSANNRNTCSYVGSRAAFLGLVCCNYTQHSFAGSDGVFPKSSSCKQARPISDASFRSLTQSKQASDLFLSAIG